MRDASNSGFSVEAGSDRYAVAVVRSGQVMGHDLPFLGFRWLLKDMASCIDAQRSLALDWIMDMQLEVQRLLVRLQFFIVLIIHC